MNAVKDLIGPAVDRLADDLEKLSRQIHDNPELGYQEIKAAAWLTEFLDKHGFKVERGVAGVETAFRGTIETGEGPTIARSEEHTSELQSLAYLVCRLLLEKKKKKQC